MDSVTHVGYPPGRAWVASFHNSCSPREDLSRDEDIGGGGSEISTRHYALWRNGRSFTAEAASRPVSAFQPRLHSRLPDHRRVTGRHDSGRLPGVWTRGAEGILRAQ